MIRQKAVIQTCEFDPYTICVEIYFERKYTVYKFDNTMGWIHMMIRQIRQSSLTCNCHSTVDYYLRHLVRNAVVGQKDEEKERQKDMKTKRQ